MGFLDDDDIMARKARQLSELYGPQTTQVPSAEAASDEEIEDGEVEDGDAVEWNVDGEEEMEDEGIGNENIDEDVESSDDGEDEDSAEYGWRHAPAILYQQVMRINEGLESNMTKDGRERKRFIQQALDQHLDYFK